MARNAGEQAGNGNSRWWESYFVRYFSGFLVGALCISVFAAHLAFLTVGDGKVEKVIATLLQKDGPIIAILVTIGILGLVYSYLVSAPITVIHYGRGVRIFWDAQSRYFWFAWAVVLGLTVTGLIEGLTRWSSFIAIIPILILLLILYCAFWVTKKLAEAAKEEQEQPQPPTGLSKVLAGATERVRKIKFLRSQQYAFIEILASVLLWAIIIILILGLVVDVIPIINKWQLNLLVFSLPAIWMGISQYVTLFKILLSERDVHSFYQQLTVARSKSNSREVRESYTHLREHSNSTFIVILELCFFCLMTLVLSLTVKSQQNLTTFLSANGEGVQMGTWLFCIFMLWSIPNLFLWSRANSMELDFSTHPEKYTGERK